MICSTWPSASPFTPAHQVERLPGARLRMYKANRRDGLCERSLTMFPVGIDVSKNTLGLCMLYD
ncbi:IS110 family transposase, partial [Acinetobacter baumannii]|nr:IS110 family transposase [Acinetobacter baumannii]